PSCARFLPLCGARRRSRCTSWSALAPGGLPETRSLSSRVVPPRRRRRLRDGDLAPRSTPGDHRSRRLEVTFAQFAVDLDVGHIELHDPLAGDGALLTVRPLGPAQRPVIRKDAALDVGAPRTTLALVERDQPMARNVEVEHPPRSVSSQDLDFFRVVPADALASPTC